MRIEHAEQSLASASQITMQNMDRRAASRFQTVFRVGRVFAHDDQGLVRIKNISDQGAHLRIRIPVMISDSLTLELAENMKMDGRVAWASGDECGLHFDKPINCDELLTRLAICTKQGDSRPLRLCVSTSAVTHGENGIRLTSVTDVSQRGMKISHDGSLTSGLKIKITLPSGLERLAVVRWSKDNFAGLMLLEPLSAENLGSARNF